MQFLFFRVRGLTAVVNLRGFWYLTGPQCCHNPADGATFGVVLQPPAERIQGLASEARSCARHLDACCRPFHAVRLGRWAAQPWARARDPSLITHVFTCQIWKSMRGGAWSFPAVPITQMFSACLSCDFQEGAADHSCHCIWAAKLEKEPTTPMCTKNKDFIVAQQ